MKNFISKISIILVTILLGQSCTKEKFNEYEKEALSRILEYKVQDSQQEILGAIDHVNNTITIYIPFYMSFEYLNATIKLDEGATLWNEEGEEINLDGGLDAVAIGDTVKYTVKSALGTERVYTLIQKIQPHKDPLVVTASGLAVGATELVKPVHSKLVLLGNFESTSRNAEFIFTDRATGKQYDNFASTFSVTPGDQYNMVVDISPEAIAGEYDLTIIHQGRSTKLNVPIKLFYQFVQVGIYPSSTRYAQGDTIVFKAQQGSTFGFPNGDVSAGVFVGLERVYIKIHSHTTTVTLASGQTLASSYYDTPIPMKVASYTRTEIRAIIPDLPPGGYLSIYDWTGNYGLNMGFAFYADFDNQTTWGKDNYLGRGATISPGFTVLPKQ